MKILVKSLMKIDSGIHLFHGDCLEVLKSLPDNSIDLVLADPPYEKMKYAASWDSMIDLDKMWGEIKRVRKDKSATVLFSQQPFASKLIHSNESEYKCEWIWDKYIARGMQTAKYKPMIRHENILIFGNPNLNYYPIMVKRDKPVKTKAYPKGKTFFTGTNDQEYRVYTHKNPVSILEGFWETNRGKIHPTQKPVALLEYLINTYSKEGEIVLDFCYGSNSCGIAAINTKRKYIGIEKDDKFYEAGKDRMINHLSSSSENNSKAS